MFKMKNLLAAALAGTIALSGAAFAKDLRVASNTTFPPFEFVSGETHEITGFEMDLVREMGKIAGYDVKIVNMGFDGIIPAILSGSVDVGASGFSVTEARKKRVLFLEPFYKSGLTILVRRGDEGKIKGFADLKGKKLAVQIGTTSASKAKEIPDAHITTFNNAGDAILDLANGGADAVINDKPVTDYLLTQQPKLAAAVVHLPEMLSADDFAMIVNKKNTKLADELNAALKKMHENGEYDKLYTKWFGKH
ncbi:MAG: Amino acid ABC transporter substrate-binding protein [Burkholderia sp.]|jgi:polar amino acid transport system substrate-binding protein